MLSCGSGVEEGRKNQVNPKNTDESETILDMRGVACPRPVVETKRAIENGLSFFEVLVDNEHSAENVRRMAVRLGCTVSVEKESDRCWRIGVRAGGGGARSPEREVREPKGADAAESGSGWTLYVPSVRMGEGVEELGGILMQAYLKTLKEISPPPSRIIFVNSGVTLVCEGSPVLEALSDLERRGVEIWACGTCLDYLHLSEDRRVGRVGNMYDIAQMLASSPRIVRP